MPVTILPAPHVPASLFSLAAAASAASSKPLARLRSGISTLAAHARALWAEIEPGFHFDRRNQIERWDCAGEGPAWNFAFEGLGITFSMFIGRTPQRYVDEEAAAWAR